MKEQMIAAAANSDIHLESRHTFPEGRTRHGDGIDLMRAGEYAEQMGSEAGYIF